MKKISKNYRKLLRKIYLSFGLASIFVLTGCMYGPEFVTPAYGMPPGGEAEASNNRDRSVVINAQLYENSNEDVKE